MENISSYFTFSDYECMRETVCFVNDNFGGRFFAVI